jgi:hypothetical protein
MVALSSRGTSKSDHDNPTRNGEGIERNKEAKSPKSGQEVLTASHYKGCTRDATVR